ncbi:MAG: hemolysin family protein [Clostridia bacterium]
MTLLSFIKIIIFLVAFTLRAGFAGSEIAYLSVSKLSVKTLAQEGNEEAINLDILLSDMQRIITIVLIGTNLTGVIATVMATNITLELGLFNSNVTVTTMLMIFLVLFLTEIIPKNIFAKNALAITLKTGKIMNVLDKLFRPLIALFNFINRIVLGEKLATDESVFNLTEDSIKTMVTIGEEEGDVEEQEKYMIYNVFESGDTYLKDIMVPRVNMIAADIEDGVEEVLELIIDSGYTRIPIYEDTIDNIIGIIHAKDLMESFINNDKIEDIQLETLLREPYFVPESRYVGELLHDMRDQGLQAAIVLDEFGGTEGFVTLEDILEEIVGEIQDEYDDDEIPEIKLNEDGSLSLDPRLSLSKVSELLDINFDDEEADTLSGLIYEKLGRVPFTGEEVEFSNEYILRVLKIEGNKIIRVKILSI